MRRIKGFLACSLGVVSVVSVRCNPSACISLKYSGNNFGLRHRHLSSIITQEGINSSKLRCFFIVNAIIYCVYYSWIEKVVRCGGGDGAEYPMKYYYVRFQRYDGLETEARLMNPNKKLKIGSRVRIRYVPGREEIATLMEME